MKGNRRIALAKGHRGNGEGICIDLIEEAVDSLVGRLYIYINGLLRVCMRMARSIMTWRARHVTRARCSARTADCAFRIVQGSEPCGAQTRI